MSTNSTNDSHCANVVEGRPIEFYIFGLLIPDIVSSMANLMVTYIFYYTVEISHPQFMIIFQNHCLGNVINVLSLVLHIFYSAIQSVPCFSTVYILLNYNALQFNFISWLCVAIMRWYFISKPDDNIVMNFPIMKTFALAFVWIFFISIKVCNNIVVQLCTIFITRLVFYSLMVLPVVLCILMYFALKIQLAKKEQLEMLQHQNRMKSNPPQNELEDQLEQSEQEKIRDRIQSHNSSALMGIEINVFIAVVMIIYGIVALYYPTHTILSFVLYGLLLMIMKNAIPIVTGIACSKKLLEGLTQYLERFHTVNC